MIVLGILFLVFPVISFMFDGIGNYDSVALLAVCIGMCYLFMELKRIRSYFTSGNNVLQWRITDVFVIVYLLYGAVHLLFIKEVGVEPLFYIKWILYLFVYLIARRAKEQYRDTLFWCFLVGMVLQAGVVVLQWLTIVPSGNMYFPVSGMFSNPAYVAVWLACLVVYVVGWWQRNRRIYSKQMGWLVYLAAVFVVFAIVLCNCRGALLALVVGGVYLYFKSVSFKYMRLDNKLLVVVGVVIAFVVGGFLLYELRPGSADLRLFIWERSMDMVKESPVWGIGIGEFKSEYMLCQANYYGEQIFVENTLVANNHYQSFNEFLHVLCEQGVVGLAIVVLMFGYAVWGCKSRERMEERAALCALLVASCFLYTADIIEVAALFPLLLGLKSWNEPEVIVCYRHSRVLKCFWKMVTVMAAVAGIAYAGVYGVRYNRAERALVELDGEVFKERGEKVPGDSCKIQAWVDNVKKFYPLIKGNIDLLPYYAELLKEGIDPEYAIEVFEDAVRLIPTSDMVCELGELYESVGNFERAEECYELSINMVPNRIVPKYKLFKLYVKWGKTGMTYKVCHSILYDPVKADGGVALRARGEVREWLDKNYIWL